MSATPETEDERTARTGAPLVITLLSEIAATDQLARGRLHKALPKGMEISHFSVLNHLDHAAEERTPAQLARAFNVTKAAITNTLSRLEASGFVHIRPDWEDGRRKCVSISPAGKRALDTAVDAISPFLDEIVEELGVEAVRTALPVLRRLRTLLSED